MMDYDQLMQACMTDISKVHAWAPSPAPPGQSLAASTLPAPAPALRFPDPQLTPPPKQPQSPWGNCRSPSQIGAWELPSPLQGSDDAALFFPPAAGQQEADGGLSLDVVLGGAILGDDDFMDECDLSMDSMFGDDVLADMGAFGAVDPLAIFAGPAPAPTSRAGRWDQPPPPPFRMPAM